MKKLSKKVAIIFVLGLIGASLFACKNKEEEINNLLTDARYALSEGKYDDARGYYQQVLDIDAENRDAMYELRDLEKAAANKDASLCDTIHNAIAYTIMGPDMSENDVPLSGDYTLEEYLNKCPAQVKEEVLAYCGVKTIPEISEKFLSTNQDGERINGYEIRVQVQSYNAFSVYIPNSYDIGREQIIYGGILPQ